MLTYILVLFEHHHFFFILFGRIKRINGSFAIGLAMVLKVFTSLTKPILFVSAKVLKSAIQFNASMLVKGLVPSCMFNWVTLGYALVFRV